MSALYFTAKFVIIFGFLKLKGLNSSDFLGYFVILSKNCIIDEKSYVKEGLENKFLVVRYAKLLLFFSAFSGFNLPVRTRAQYRF